MQMDKKKFYELNPKFGNEKLENIVESCIQFDHDEIPSA